jgi:hypothetical protein
MCVNLFSSGTSNTILSADFSDVLPIPSCDVLKSKIGLIDTDGIHSNGASGFLVHGPYITLPKGYYAITFLGVASQNAKINFEVVYKNGTIKLQEGYISNNQEGEFSKQLCFSLEFQIQDIETRVFVHKAEWTTIYEIKIHNLKEMEFFAKSQKINECLEFLGIIRSSSLRQLMDNQRVHFTQILPAQQEFNAVYGGAK